jgi:hypothetical protein
MEQFSGSSSLIDGKLGPTDWMMPLRWCNIGHQETLHRF